MKYRSYKKTDDFVQKRIIFLLNKNKLDDALELLKKSKQRLPENFYYGQLIYILTEKKEFKAAADICSEALKLENVSSELYNNISWCCFEVDQYEKAIFYAEKSIALNKNDCYPYVNKGNALIELNMPTQAITAFKCALDINPEFRYAISGMGISLYMNKQFRECIPYLKETLKNEKTNAGIIKYLADSYFVLKQYDECIDMYKLLVKAAPASSWMFCNMGDLYCYSGDFKNAFSSFNEAIKIDPSCTTAYYYKSRLYSLLRQSENSLKCLEKAISLNPDYKKIALNDDLLNNIKIYSKFKDLVSL